MSRLTLLRFEHRGRGESGGRPLDMTVRLFAAQVLSKRVRRRGTGSIVVMIANDRLRDGLNLATAGA